MLGLLLLLGLGLGACALGAYEDPGYDRAYAALRGDAARPAG
jgi:hypothetical protein